MSRRRPTRADLAAALLASVRSQGLADSTGEGVAAGSENGSSPSPPAVKSPSPHDQPALQFPEPLQFLPHAKGTPPSESIGDDESVPRHLELQSSISQGQHPLDRVRVSSAATAGVAVLSCAALATGDLGALPAGAVFLLLIVVAGLSGIYRYADILAAIIGVLAYAILEAGSGGNLRSLGIAVLAFGATTAAVRFLSSELAADEHRERQTDEVLEELTMYDPISGLLKPRYGENAIEDEVKRARRADTRLTLILVAPDPDSPSGQYSGLPESAQATLIGAVFRDILRTTDRASRLGPLLFAAILPDTGGDGATLVAAKLRLAAEDRGSPPLRCGVATFPDNAVSATELREEAETALQLARSANLEVVSPDMLDL